MCGWLGLERDMMRSSELGIDGERSERLLNLCLHFGAHRYLSGNAAQRVSGRRISLRVTASR